MTAASAVMGTMPRFQDAAHSLATAAESLSKAAQSMAEAALAMSEASQLFEAIGLMAPVSPKINDDMDGIDTGSGHEIHEDNEGEEDEDDDEDEEHLTDHESKASSGDVVLYEDDDFGIPNLTSNTTDLQPHDTRSAGGIKNELLSSLNATPLQSWTVSPTPVPPPPASRNDEINKSDLNAAKTVAWIDSLNQAESIPTTSLEATRPFDTGLSEGSSYATTPLRNTSTNASHHFMKRLQPDASGSIMQKQPDLHHGYYVRLQEDFDAIPVILCMAIASHKTICLLPSLESLDAYKGIFSAVTGLDVFSGDIDMFMATPFQSLLLLDFESIADVEVRKASVDCVVHWGWPLEQYSKGLAELIGYHPWTFFVLPSGQHLKPRNDSAPVDYKVHPYLGGEINKYFEPENLIHDIRKETMLVLAEVDDKVIEILYHGWLKYHGSGSTQRTDWTTTDLERYGRDYAAKVLLHGLPNDGSKKYPPVSTRMPPLSNWIVEAANSSPHHSPTEDQPNSANNSPTPLILSVNTFPQLPWGRSYIQLQEDFDAIPIISCMALANKKTICLIPISGAIESYGKILTSITKLKIFLPLDNDSDDRLDSLVTAFVSATASSILLLASEAIPHNLLEAPFIGCVIHWGWPPNPKTYLNESTLLRYNIRMCLILPAGKHLKPFVDFEPSECGVAKCSNTILSGLFGPESPINKARKITTQVLADTDSGTMKMLYHSWLEYHGIGSTQRGDWTILDLMRYAREYAAKTLLRGPTSDGSKLYPPTVRLQLPLPEWVIRALDSLQPTPVQPVTAARVKPDTQFSGPSCSTPVPPTTQGTDLRHLTPAPTSNEKINILCFPSSSKINTELTSPGIHFLVLIEDFDAVPFILYLGLANNKTVCCVPSHDSLNHLAKLFKVMIDLEVIYPGSINDVSLAQDEFKMDSRPCMLLQSYIALQSSPLPNASADALVCWGYPENLDSYISGGAKSIARSYLILTPEEYARPTVQVNLARLHITRHPLTNLVNDISSCGLLHQARQKVKEHFQLDEFSPVSYSLYYSFICYYSVGRGRPAELIPEQIARKANTYAAKVLLRGTLEDGSLKYPPVAGRPKLTPGAIKAFKLKSAQNVGLLD